MNPTNRRLFVFAAALTVAWITAPLTSLQAQNVPAGLPEGWDQLSVEEFVMRASEYYEDGDLVGVDEAAVRQHAAERFRQIDLLNTELSYQVLLGLQWGARPYLQWQDHQQLRNALLARQDDWTGQPYNEMQYKVILMHRVEIPFELCVREARRWVAAGGKPEDIQPNDSDVWPDEVAVARHAFAESEAESIEGSFSVHWEGQVSAPQTGQYTFSISPINVNSTDHEFALQETMTVKVGGQTILSATPAQWTSDSSPVTLTAGEPADLSVDLSVRVQNFPARTVHALLYWEGPGVAKSIVPKNRLSQPEQAGPGLKGTYTWIEGGAERTVTRIDPTIDFAWPQKWISLAQRSTEQDNVVNAYWLSTTSSNYLSWTENVGGEVRRHPFLVDPMDISENISSARRQEFLDELLARPALLDALDARHAQEFYQAFRFGAADKALDAFGTWATRHADWECELPVAESVIDFDLDSRTAFRKLADCVTHEFPEHAARLQNEYLTLPDGTCCLPVAYTLAYSYLSRGEIDRWIEILASHLQESTSVGDRRVNWLLARAQADEIKQGTPKPYYVNHPRLMDGRVWIDEATLVAESPEVKLRAIKELASRLMALGRFGDARELLAKTAEDASGSAAAEIASWQQAVDDLEEARSVAQAEQAAAAQEAYLSKLRERRDRAAQNGDTGAVNRYQALIDAAGSNE